MQQCPQVTISACDDAAAFAAVAAVRTGLRIVRRPGQMRGARPAIAGPPEYLYIIDELFFHVGLRFVVGLRFKV